jgi:hypothetical protein
VYSYKFLLVVFLHEEVSFLVVLLSIFHDCVTTLYNVNKIPQRTAHMHAVPSQGLPPV